MLEGARLLRELVYAGKLDAGAHLLTSTLITWFTSKGIPVHPHIRQSQAAYTK